MGLKELGWQGEGWGTGEHMKECIRGGVEGEEGTGAEAEIDWDGEMREVKGWRSQSSRRYFV